MKRTETDTREPAVARAPHDGGEAGVSPWGGPEEVRAALDANVAAARACRDMPAYERAAALRRVADALVAEKESLARTLALEAGKPISQARTEIDRTISVFRDGAEEATRLEGELLPADAVPIGAGRIALARRFPLAPIAAITPFNFPLLLAAKNLAPAMACGASITLKPPPQDPLTTLRLGELIWGSGYPDGGVRIVPCHVEVAQILIEDPRVRMITFTGSARAGWAIRAKAGTKRVALELGGNAAVIVATDADLGWAAARCAIGGGRPPAPAGRRAGGSLRRAHGPGAHDARDEGELRGGVRAARDGDAVPADRGRRGRRERYTVRPASGHIHARSADHVRGLGRARRGRRQRQRHSRLSGRPPALRWCQGVGAGARGRALRDSRNDRAAAPDGETVIMLRLWTWLDFTHMSHRPPVPGRWWAWCAAASLPPSIRLTFVSAEEVPYRDIVWLGTLVPAFPLSLHYGS